VQGIHPLNIDVSSPARVGRWRPLVNWLLVVPHRVWLLVLWLGAGLVVFLGWFAIVFTSRLPDSWSDYVMAVLRYHWRMTAYLLGWADQYPGFRPIAGHVDPGDYPAIFYCARPTARKRLTVLFRAVLVIPHYLALYVIGLAAFIILVVAWFTVLITGRWPREMRAFLSGWLRWGMRVLGYSLLVTDEYPPFSFKA
jgi:Domain of unknown function (DUF4389)